ncbi:MAG TPA: hypothetical protein VFW89_05425 [Gemmatimonadaceae bacterium]|nr:hypothetical protein [Gemmatimonadaceae bacterium]
MTTTLSTSTLRPAQPATRAGAAADAAPGAPPRATIEDLRAQLVALEARRTMLEQDAATMRVGLTARRAQIAEAIRNGDAPAAAATLRTEHRRLAEDLEHQSAAVALVAAEITQAKAALTEALAARAREVAADAERALEAALAQMDARAREAMADLIARAAEVDTLTTAALRARAAAGIHDPSGYRAPWWRYLGLPALLAAAATYQRATQERSSAAASWTVAPGEPPAR